MLFLMTTYLSEIRFGQILYFGVWCDVFVVLMYYYKIWAKHNFQNGYMDNYDFIIFMKGIRITMNMAIFSIFYNIICLYYQKNNFCKVIYIN